MNTLKKGLKNTIFGVLAQVVTIVIGLFLPRLILLAFGSEVNGLVHSSAQIFTYFTLFEAGVGTASLQALYAPVANGNRDEINGIMSATGKFFVKTGIFYGLAVTALAFVYPLVVSSSLNYWLVFGVIFFGGIGNAINFIYQAKFKILMQAEGFSFVSTNIQTITYLVTSLLKIVLVYMGCSILMVQIASFAVSVGQMLVYYIYVQKHYSWVNLKAEPNNAAISKKNAALVHQISYMIYCNTDVLLLTLLLQDLKLVSVYTLYYLIISTICALIQSMSNGFDFKMGQIFQTDMDRYKKLHHVYEIAYLGLLFSAMTAFYVLVLPFMTLYTSGITDVSYVNASYPLLFVLVQLLSGGRTAENNVINFAGHFEETKLSAILEAGLNVVVSIFCIMKWGFIGALIGTIVALLYRTSYIIFYAYKKLLKESPWKTIKRWLVCFAVFFASTKLWNFNPSGITNYLLWFERAILVTLASLAAYGLALAITNPEEVKEGFGLIKKHIFKKEN